MSILKRYEKFAYRVSKNWSRKYLLGYFKDVHSDLQKANIPLTLIEYMSLALTTSLLVFVAMAPLITVIISVVLRASGHVFTSALFFGMLMGLFGGILAGGSIFFFFYLYPSLMLGERKKKIDNSISFATLYLATIAGSGTPIITMFKTLARFKEYGEISEESKRIVEDVEVTGLDMAEALGNAANRTPSEDFKELLWGIKTTITVGGDLKAFLHEKSTTAFQENRRRLTQFREQLALFIEIYITVVFVGSIFFMILSTIMGGIGGGSGGLMVSIQIIITFLFLPGASLGLLILIRGISPTSR